MYIALAVFCTFLSAVLGYFLVQPVALALVFPIATMGGFILYAVLYRDKITAKEKYKALFPLEEEDGEESKHK